MPPPRPPPPANANAANTVNNATNAANTVSNTKNVANTADIQWLAFRRRHDQELKKFQQDVGDRRKKFEEDVQKYRLALLGKHKREEEEFWKDSSKNAMEDRAGSGDGTKASAKHSTAGRKIAEKKKPAIEKEKDARAVKQKTDRLDKNAGDRASAQTVVKDKKAPVAYSDLMSDNEEDDEDELVEIKKPNTASVPPSANTTKKSAAPAPSTKLSTWHTCQRASRLAQLARLGRFDQAE
ncbi:hypothetical protein PtrSN001C_003970 [Pyrenophora tritici-repentis]|nr:hypothetical protein PtrSN001C_003970 [Pyrenophora tritici-repentis]